MTSQEAYYRRERANSESNIRILQSEEASRSWFDRDTADAWRHERMRSALLPLLAGYPESTWLTVGDAWFGADANFLLRHGVRAHATDLTDVMLKAGKERGFIDDYSVQNAEELSFADESFDFVYCKEAYHHFPRPPVALYEMLRVARLGVALHEPRDEAILETAQHYFFHGLKHFTRLLLGRPLAAASYEDVGNYVYQLSAREVEKTALGLNLPVVAFRTMADHYEAGLEKVKPVDSDPRFQALRRKIEKSELRLRRGMSNGGLLTAIIFKKNPPGRVKSALREHGFLVRDLPRNPHAAAD